MLEFVPGGSFSVPDAELNSRQRARLNQIARSKAVFEGIIYFTTDLTVSEVFALMTGDQPVEEEEGHEAE